MKFLKIVGYIVAALIVLILILGAIAPKEVTTSRSIVINADQATVFSLVNELPSWERWSPWQQRDSTIINTYGEKTAGTGASYSWTSKDSGDGELTITESFEADSIHIAMIFDGQGNAFSNWYFEPVDGGTKATWTFASTFPFPFNAIIALQDVEGMLNKDYDEGLAFLKAEAERILPEPPTLRVQRIDFPATRYVGQRKTVGIAELSDHFQTVMPDVGVAVAESGAEMTGAPSGLYYLWDEEQQMTDLAIAIPVAAGTELDGLEVFDLPAGPALQVDYVGVYDGVGTAHEALDAYMQANGLTRKEPAIEAYLADPGPETETDPNKWMTQVIYLLER